MDFYKHLH